MWCKNSPRRRPHLLGSGLAVAVAVAALCGVGAAPALAGDYSKQTLHFRVTVGPNNDQSCDIVGDLYKPRSATPATPAPAILTTNGFGGKKEDQADLAMTEASRGYVVLSYSGLGFGGSGCKITLDDPDYDGKAASQLVTFLGGGMAATDDMGHQVTPIDYVKHDSVAHDGQHHAFDPRVGLIGGSYGGEFQFAVAGIDPRVDTIIPIITWNDLSYSLAPNNTAFDHGVTYNIHNPGVEKFQWTSLFFGVGIVDGISGASADPTRNVGCPNFDNRACGAKAQMDATGAPDETTLALARHASVESYIQNIHIPTLLAQGQGDTLFNLQEATATYSALRAQGVPTKMIWQSWGHSTSTPAPGEFSKTDPSSTYEGRTFLEWFDHYLADAPTAPTLDFTYFRDFVPYTGDATAAYARAPSYPAAAPQQMFLSGSDALVSSPSAITPGAASFLTPAAGAPTSYTETSAVDQSAPVTDAPGTFAKFTGAPLSADEDVVGIPTADVTVSAPTFANAASTTGPAGELTLFFKLYDVKPDGTIVLVHRLISPVRIADFSRQVHVELPGIVHRFAKGDRIALTIAASDAAYRGTNIVGPVTITVDPAHPDTLSLPVLATSAQLPIATTPLAASISVLGASGSGACARGLRVPVVQTRGARVTLAAVYVNNKLVRRVHGSAIKNVLLARVPRGVYTVTIKTRTNRGAGRVSVAHYRGCQRLRGTSHRHSTHHVSAAPPFTG